MNTFMQKLGVLTFTLSVFLSASAADFEVDGICYNITDSEAKTVEVTSSSRTGGYSGDITLPASVTHNDEQYAVTAIGEDAFRRCLGLTSITIPNSVTILGKYAFLQCHNLTSINIPASVTTIDYGALNECTDLISITIPNSVTTIGEDVFYYCTSLISIDVDKDNQAYSSGEGILYNKTQTNLICCPAGKIGEVIIPNSVTTIGNGAFDSCTGLTLITIPNSVTTIGENAFAYCSSLTSITIPNSVTTIGNYAFDSCSGLTSITIPNSVTTIGKNAFSSCSSLTSITIPNSVTTIGDYAFNSCSGLTSIISFAIAPPASGSDVFYNVDTQNCTLYVPAESREDYRQAAEWSAFDQTENIVYVSGIELNETEVNIEEGTTFSLTAEVQPADATVKNLQWETSNASCVTVDESGLLTAHANGTATITVRSYDGNAEATCTVTVVPTTGIEAVEAAANGTTEVFTLTGVKVARTTANLPAGIYLLRHGSAVRKVIVK